MKKVITYGTYDLFHQGHYNLLKRAKELGDYLIVGVTTDHFDEARGKVNVVDSLMTRIENVRATGFADEIIVEDHVGQKIEDIQKYNVDIFTLGSDWVGTFDYLKQFCEVIYLDRTPDVSSTQIRNNSFKIINLGIVGTGRIVPRFLSEIKYVSGVNVVCTYNPYEKRKIVFDDKYTLKNYSAEFGTFLNKVDAVYIASPNETHYEYAKKALENGKHVLVEKPLCFTKKEAEELYNYAKSNDLVLMEAIKTAYCPGFQQLMNVANSGVIGDVKDIEATYTRLASSGSRERTDANYGGSFLEFGSYTLLPALKLLGRDYTNLRFKTIYDENGVDIYTKTELEFADGMGSSKNGVAVKSEGNLVISGTKGYILAPSPWWLTRRFEVRYEDPNKVEVYEPSFQGDGFRYEISEFVLKINGVEKNGYKYTAGEAIVMAEIIERYMEQKKG
ncbi:MAG: Gfo/Idh/MocA family oxidoreductase [Lachnospiraceae bacterium]|nr:Gfo/Idh/MocA family oxidoreductase [Lachnospiraceae bacterium]